jgi:tRNA-splicing endonuclease subunit Sen34
LGTGTKKAGLICCVEGEEGEGEVSFYSLEWANFG